MNDQQHFFTPYENEFIRRLQPILPQEFAPEDMMSAILSVTEDSLQKNDQYTLFDVVCLRNLKYRIYRSQGLQHDTRGGEVMLSARDQAFIQRLRKNYFPNSSADPVAFLRAMNISKLRLMSGVGLKTTTRLAQLRKMVMKEVRTQMMAVCSSLPDLSSVELELNRREKKVIERLRKAMYGPYRSDAEMIMAAGEQLYDEIPGGGVRQTAIIENLQERIITEHYRSDDQIESLPTDDVQPGASFSQIEDYLIGTLYRIFFSLNHTNQAIFSMVHGFGTARQSQKKTGEIINVTESRICQLRTGFFDEYAEGDSVYVKNSSWISHELIFQDIPKIFPRLSSMFHDYRGYYSCLSSLIRVKSNLLLTQDANEMPPIPATLFARIFSEMTVPCAVEDFYYVLSTQFGFDKYHFWLALNRLKQEGQLRCDGDQITWVRLDKMHKIEQTALLFHEGVSSSELVTAAGLKSPWVRSGRGGGDRHIVESNSRLCRLSEDQFCHKKYFHKLQKRSSEYDAAIQKALDHSGRLSVDSEELYRNSHVAMDRYLFREYLCDGVAKGYLKVSGRRAQEVFPYAPEFASHQVLAYLKKSGQPMTREQVLDRFPFLERVDLIGVFHNLLDEGQLARVSHRQFQYFKKAYADMKVDHIRPVIESVVNGSELAMESDYLKEILNKELKKNYNKYQYYSLARSLQIENVVVDKFLFSTKNLPWDGLLDVVESVREDGMNANDIIEEVESLVKVTSHVKDNLIRSYLVRQGF
ncbi:MAG: hypothetical protein AB8C84_01015 [Oligoflexales bacterium]